MTVILVLAVLFSFGGSDGPSPLAEPPRAELEGTRSYLELPLDELGRPPTLPYVWEMQSAGKHLVVVGTRHIFDPRSPMYLRLDGIFERVQPQLVLHEGTAHDALGQLSRAQAIKAGADLGYTIQRSMRAGIDLRSGDAPANVEIQALLRQYSAADVLVFMTAQRLIGSGRAPDLNLAAEEYPDFYRDLLANGLPGDPHWRDWIGFLAVFEGAAGHALSADSWHPESYSPIHDAGKYSDMARSLNAARDQHLFAEIRRALHTQDRVLVIFGNWHVLALEPVLATTFAADN